MQKMLEDFMKAMEQQTLQIQYQQQEKMEKVFALEEDKESETESETESNNVLILEYPQTSSPLYIENKITLAAIIAQGTVVMLLERPKSQIVQEVKHTEGPVSKSPSPATPETLEELVLLTCVEDTSLEEPILEKSEPTTNPFDTNESEQSIDEELPCDAESIPFIEVLNTEVSLEDSDEAFFDSLFDGYDHSYPKESYSQMSWDELLMSDTEDSGEGHVVIIEPSTESQPIKDLKNQILALKANDVDTPRRLPPPPVQGESPQFFLLPPSRRNESKILDFDWIKIKQSSMSCDEAFE
ncbi:unnamed protein product [Cuscuta campestris]|uniref:Uncharacterized protein n=1 Tax=Cuscuta campestris TaxID=132261 RepID=A0A484KZ41_9ASTE|nr:unnamed protein product [Cuscuta campestris]